MVKEFVAINEDGEITGRYSSIKQAAKEIGVNYNTLVYWYRNFRPHNGSIFILANIYELLTTEERKALFTSPPPNLKTQMKRVRVREKAKVSNHTVSYQVKYGFVSITPCPFHSGTEKPMVGGYQCVRCASFVGKDKQLKQVYCGFNKAAVKGIPSKH